MSALRKLLAEATPGPWECGKGAGWFIKREGRRAALMVGMRAEYSIISDGQVTERSSSGPECEANARLMALAPSLAAALLKAEEALRECDKLRAVMCEASPGSGDTLAAWLEGFDAASGAFRAALSDMSSITGGGE